ncbi:MAG: hypothetical protein ACFFDJ_06100 [Candidatus Odinarchaeota archaeon]
MTNWLCPIDEANWGIILENRVWGVGDEFRSLLDQIEQSDSLVFCIKDTYELRGIYRVNSSPFESTEIRMLDDTAFPAKITYWVKLTERVMPVYTIDFQKLLTNHDMFQSRRRDFQGQFSKPLILLTDSEYRVLYEIMKKASSVLVDPEGDKRKSWQYYRWANRRGGGYW